MSNRKNFLRSKFDTWLQPSKGLSSSASTAVHDEPIRVIQNINGGGLVEALYIKAKNETVDYVAENMPEALIFGYREALWNFALRKAESNFLELHNDEQAVGKDFIIAEFGVWEGYSINYFAQRYPTATILGFDSFEGLEEDWTGHDLVKGHFILDGKIPVVADNVTLIKGWFKDTIPKFANQNRKIHLVHFDADTYTPTSTVLSNISGSLADGCIFIFDEYQNFPGWKNHEFKAFAEFIDRTNFRYKYIGITDFQQVAVQIYLI